MTLNQIFSHSTLKDYLGRSKEFFLKRYTPVGVAAAAFVLLFFWLITFGDQGLFRLQKLYSLKNQLFQERIKLDNKIVRLEKEAELLKDKKYLESIIRKELGYIKNGEIIFHVVKPR
ncbi:septum formation initiator family protein [bacterium]|nr:septum formation initiator family protein [bacterium]